MLIDLGAFTLYVTSQHEEMLCMNSDAEHAGQPHSHETHLAHAEHDRTAGGADAWHSEHGDSDHRDSPGLTHVEHSYSDAEEKPAFSGKEMEMYRVLLAVERGEVSAEEAGRQLEALESGVPGAQDGSKL